MTSKRNLKLLLAAGALISLGIFFVKTRQTQELIADVESETTSVETPKDQVHALPAYKPKPTLASKLPLELIGTIINEDPDSSLGSVLIKNHAVANVVRRTQDLENIATIESIQRDRLYLRNYANGEIEFITLGAYDPARAVTPEAMDSSDEKKEFHIQRSLIDEVLNGKLPELLQQAKAVPVMENRTITGFRLDWFEQSSLFGKLGLKEGDVLKSVNGVKLDSLAAVMRVFEQFQNSSMIELGVERGGKSQSITYLIR